MATIVINSWSEVGLNINPYAVNTKSTCPNCSSNRKHSSDRCLSVSATKGVASCKHCGVAYVIRKESKFQEMKIYSKPEVKQLPVSDKTIQFFKSRGIEERTIEYFKVTDSMEWMRAGKDKAKEGITRCINFNYFDDNELINVKFRGSEKRFKLSVNAKLIFYNINAIKELDECCIQEGEIDTMTAYQCNVFNSVSVPNGASKGNANLEYLDNCIDYFANKKKIILGTDDDEAGRALRDELSRRLGREKCWFINYPEGCKDTNEVLLKYGSKAVKTMYDEAYPAPIEGIFTGDDLASEIRDIYNNGFPNGNKIGYKGFDDLISFRPGELTTIVAIPGSGKSKILDQILVRLASRFGWKSGVFSPEHQPSSLHATSLISQFTGGEMIGKGKISEMKREKGIEFVNEFFFFMKVDEIDVTIDGILSLAEELVVKKGIKALLIDPYNYIEHKIPKGYTETQYISELLTKICRFMKTFQVHVFLIVHPTKIQKNKETGKYNVPTLYDCSGSSHFFNKTYNGFTVYRDFDTNVVTVYVQKIKYTFIGKLGECNFVYDIKTGRYAVEGTDFENELDRYIHMQSQSELEFKIEREPVLISEPAQLTDLTKLSGIKTSFDDYTTETIFKFTDNGELKPNTDIETPF